MMLLIFIVVGLVLYIGLRDKTESNRKRRENSLRENNKNQIDMLRSGKYWDDDENRWI